VEDVSVACDILIQGFKGLIDNTYQQDEFYFMQDHLQSTSLPLAIGFWDV
jgi:hypothetical protein